MTRRTLCKDCEHWRKTSEPARYGYCGESLQITPENHFCGSFNCESGDRYNEG